jgi:hypothetical protein
MTRGRRPRTPHRHLFHFFVRPFFCHQIRFLLTRRRAQFDDLEERPKSWEIKILAPSKGCQGYQPQDFGREESQPRMGDIGMSLL